MGNGKEGKTLLTIVLGYQNRHAARSCVRATFFPRSHTSLLLACRTVHEDTVRL